MAVLLNEWQFALNHDDEMNKALLNVLNEGGMIHDLEMWKDKIDFSKIVEPIELEEKNRN